jgi:ABC-type multidrug transport system fused ATPase/permease subunit
VNSETNLFEINGNEAIDKALGFYENVESHGLLLNTTITSLVIICVWHMVNKIKNGKVSVTFFITFMTMVLLYRDKMISMVQMIPDFIEFFGRTSTMLQFFKDFGLEKLDVEKNKYQDVNLPFHQLQFVNVGFYYNGAEDNPVLKNFNLTLNTVQNKIIGITGLSGRGKSTIMKLLLKIYEIKEGTIYIDGVDVLKLQPEYIRKNITYVNQTGKLFDRKVIDNIMYGCDKSEECSKQLHHIMKYPKIQELFKDIDIFNKTSGALGENLSGGQRQVINIIGGLINPSKILILDEPTNALDGQLKKEIIQIIKEYRKNKHAILIITHDKEVYSIFNEVVAL